ncbi:ACT domain-containing protein [Enterococcus dongliensis]|uniref:ACT domain-containing protein n=1 Tax=Enterococcus dongliensis TaxID=2559925 RepID=A0AAP5NI23_9ENTE|nr:ACT domain-containing protein [Enterococcus dongliensis]MDT2595522.1 ACT domain-containing protein [Enterococcus dongliensis]MDT2603262.1 ACT domain-containing protein [Enterococcus dongliensis]MDT2633625.1 ACT domain-containing protein [Enterococcus dongliensis]MDT2636001.1 ACT domain-containing protein [Enterococcus dongliensis]MDT2639725.1 ACT domain-containing protein [Enterococcus dongliensis]
MNLITLPQELSVYQVSDLHAVDLTQQPLFIGINDEEISVVSATDTVPADTIEREDGWKAFKIEGILDFSLVGILAKIATLLAEVKISIFAVSTYNTDYILVKADDYVAAITVLQENGYTIKQTLSD